MPSHTKESPKSGKKDSTLEKDHIELLIPSGAMGTIQSASSDTYISSNAPLRVEFEHQPFISNETINKFFLFEIRRLDATTTRIAGSFRKIFSNLQPGKDHVIETILHVGILDDDHLRKKDQGDLKWHQLLAGEYNSTVTITVSLYEG